MTGAGTAGAAGAAVPENGLSISTVGSTAASWVFDGEGGGACGSGSRGNLGTFNFVLSDELKTSSLSSGCSPKMLSRASSLGRLKTGRGASGGLGADWPAAGGGAG